VAEVEKERAGVENIVGVSVSGDVSALDGARE